jgi:hypothetical protein
MLLIQVIVLVRRVLLNCKLNLIILFNIDMDCDGLKKDLITDLDGTLLGLPGSVFSQAEYLWGN